MGEGVHPVPPAWPQRSDTWELSPPDSGRPGQVSPSSTTPGHLVSGIRQKSASPSVWLPSPLPPHGSSLGRSSESPWETRRAAPSAARQTAASGGSVCLVAQQCSRELPPGSDPKMLEREDGGPWPSNAPQGTESEHSCQGTEEPRAPLTSDSLKYGQCCWQSV